MRSARPGVAATKSTVSPAWRERRISSTQSPMRPRNSTAGWQRKVPGGAVSPWGGALAPPSPAGLKPRATPSPRPSSIPNSSIPVPSSRSASMSSAGTKSFAGSGAIAPRAVASRQLPASCSSDFPTRARTSSGSHTNTRGSATKSRREAERSPEKSGSRLSPFGSRTSSVPGSSSGGSQFHSSSSASVSRSSPLSPSSGGMASLWGGAVSVWGGAFGAPPSPAGLKPRATASNTSRSGTIVTLSTSPVERCVAGSKWRIDSTVSPTKSRRTGCALPAGKMSITPPRTQNSPCASTGSWRVKPASASSDRSV